MATSPFGLSADQWTSVQALINNAVQSAVSVVRTAAPPRRMDINPPDSFDGSDTSLGAAFVNQCEMVFRTRSTEYQDDKERVNYAANFLRGAALRWFIPFLSVTPRPPTPGGTVTPDILGSWSVFKFRFIQTFGDADQVKSASIRITSLAMANHHHVLKYSIDFSDLATYLSDWSDPSLQAQYYKGLAPRIKDDLSKVPWPSTYDELVSVTRSMDQRYWARRDEESHELRRVPRTSPGFNPAPSAFSAPPSPASSAHPDKRDKRSATPFDLSGILGPDGKLTPAEKQRRRELGLCMWCGSGDHLRPECPSAPPLPATSARASATEPGTAGNTTFA